MKTQKGIIHLGLILILLIFGIGALVFVMYKTNSLPVVTTTSSPTPEAVVIDTSDWKTYVDEKYHYRLNYPKEWSLEKQTGENPIYGHYQYLEFKSMDDNFVFIFGLRYKSEENISLDNRTGTPAGEFIEGDSLQIDGIILSEKRIVYKNNTNTVFFATNGNDKNYEVLADFAYIGSDPYYIERYDIVKTDQYKIVRKILSTFEFVDTPGDSESWNTYTNTKYKYTFEYPKSWKVDDELTKDGATNTSESVLIYSPETNGTGTLFNGITIQNSGMLVDTTNRYRVTLPNVATTVYKQDTMHGEVYYINIPDTDQFLSLTGAGGYTDNEDVNQIVKKIFSTFKLPY